MTKTSINLAAGAILAASFLLDSGFQSYAPPQERPNQDRQQGMTQTRPRINSDTAPQTQPMNYNKASEIVGMNVRNQYDEKLGEIKDVVFDLKSERIGYAVLGTGGVLSQKLVAVPLSAFTPSSDGKHLILRADKNKLETAQGLDKNNWPSVTNPAFGAEPFWEKSGTGGDINR